MIKSNHIIMSTTNDEGETVLEFGDEGYVLKEGDEGYVAPDGDDKPKETPAERVARLEGSLKRARKDAGLDDDKPEDKKSSKKTEEFDYGQKAFLVAKGIEDADEIALVKDIMASSGKSLDDVMGSNYFKAELKELREAKETSAAVPGNGKRSGAGSANTVEYWIAKGGLPTNTPDNQKLRQDIVNARMKKSTEANHFTDNPVIGG